MQLLSLFSDAGKKAESEGKYLSWTAPVTNFPCVQYYVEGQVKKLYVQYGPKIGKMTSSGYAQNALQISVAFNEYPQRVKRKQASGAAPNIVHSMDAAHLTMTVCAADFTITTIHDSFGCLANDMPNLYRIVREQFVKLYKVAPLAAIAKDIDMPVDIEYGSFKIEEVLESEYSFC
jgi:DNA-directed RNA polymerase